MQLVRLDQVLGLSTRTVDGLVEIFGFPGEIGDDEAGVVALRRGLDVAGRPGQLLAA